MMSLQSSLLEPYQDRLLHGFTVKPNAVSDRSLARETVLENRRVLCQQAGLAHERLIVPDQVHGNRVAVDSEADFTQADGVVLVTPQVPAMVITADCVPVLLYDPRRHVGAVVHAGWRGTSLAIVSQAILVLRQRANSHPADLIAVLGPAITGAYYPVGKEVLEALKSTVADTRAFEAACVCPPAPIFANGPMAEQHFVDVRQVNRLQLEALGVVSIEVMTDCTYQQVDQFWSHRRGETGRQGAYLQLLAPCNG
ncbi:MAG: peptidoglycan editing factor PgeF [Candidatus Melainabacteria bacterium]|nr:peptidoglycan editing factor PgeF [Candidatus Melainabacteria bacterium]